MTDQDTQKTQFQFGKKLQNEHGFKLLSPSQVNRELDTQKLFTHVITYQKARCYQNPEIELVIDCVITVPLSDVTLIGVDFKIQFESFTGTINMNNFFITHGDFTVIDVADVVNQLFEIAYTYGKTSYLHFSKHSKDS